MNSDLIEFQGETYNTHPYYGVCNPKQNYWYDSSCVNVTDDIAVLNISNNSYEDKNFGSGQLISEEHYLYGVFEWEYILPKGRNLWPAIWLTGAENWPPEIDVMEGWTNTTNYRKYVLFNTIMPNLHYDTDNKTYQKGSLGLNYTLRCLQPIDKTNRCKLVWYPDLIEMSYNNTVLMHVTDKNMLYYFNEPMLLIMNNAVTDKFTQSDYDDYKKNGRPFKILSFKYKA